MQEQMQMPVNSVMTDDSWEFDKHSGDWKFPFIMAQKSAAYELRSLFWTLPWTFLLWALVVNPLIV